MSVADLAAAVSALQVELVGVKSRMHERDTEVESLRETIVNGRHGSMPAHGPLLGETRARLVAAYVWSLSHGNARGAGTPR